MDKLEICPTQAKQVRDGIIAAYAFAAVDPYRAATHNKGIMNGVDSVVIATGNDWRAIEAGAHAYAARSGRYTSLSTWGKDNEGNLVGTLEMPMAVGIVGGATKVHPAAQAAVKLMGVKPPTNSPRSSSRWDWLKTWPPSAHSPPKASNADTCHSMPVKLRLRQARTGN